MLQKSTNPGTRTSLPPQHLSLNTPALSFNDRELSQQAAAILLHHYFLHLCTPEQQNQLIQHIRISRYHRQQTILKQQQSGQELLIVLQGTIKLSWNLADGKCITHYFLPAGYMMNIVHMVLDRPVVHDYSAHEPTIIAAIPRQVFMAVLQNNHLFSLKIFELICKRYYALFEATFQQINQSLRTRLVHKLLFLVDHFSHAEANIIQINIKLSQEHFAELLQTSRQSINKELRWLAQERIVEVKYHQIIILDLQKLKALSV